MKLYTEEDLKKVISIYSEEYKTSTDEILSELDIRPIELPSDEEIEKFAFERSVILENSKLFEPLQVGAKWLKRQITKTK